MEKSSTLYVGLDVHKDSIEIATAGAGRDSEVRHVTSSGGDLAALDRAQVRDLAPPQRARVQRLLLLAGAADAQAASGAADGVDLVEDELALGHARREDRRRAPRCPYRDELAMVEEIGRRMDPARRTAWLEQLRTEFKAKRNFIRDLPER